MAAVLRISLHAESIARLLGYQKASEPIMFRKLSSLVDLRKPDESPKPFFLMGLHRNVELPGSRVWSLDDHLEEFLCSIQFQQEGSLRSRSPLFTSQTTLHGICFSQLGILAFKTLDVIDKEKGECADDCLERPADGKDGKSDQPSLKSQYATFLKKIFREKYGLSPSDLPTEYQTMMVKLESADSEIEDSINDPCFLPDEKYATLLIDLQRILR
ncbi:hypothetical protein ACP70R_027885 [Stipagrostis hirtigluma subsp. patula]